MRCTIRDNRMGWIFNKVCGHLSVHGGIHLHLVRQFGQHSAASACAATTAEQHPRSHQRSFPLSCLSASADTYTITASPPRRYYYRQQLPPPSPSPTTTTIATTVRDTSTTVVRDLHHHHHHHHVRPAPAPKRRRAPSSPRYESVGRHEPRVLGLPVFIRS